MTSGTRPTVLTSYAEVREGFRHRDFRQALYDVGGLVMADSLITLHGDDHKRRRRVENRLFRRGTFRWWELHLVPGIIASTYARPVAQGHAELVHLGRRAIMYLTAMVAGIDPPESDEQSEELEHFAHIFGLGATLVHSTLDRDDVNRDVEAAMRSFDERFLEPSIQRRRQLIDDVEAGRADEDDLPKDVLVAVLRNQEDLNLDRDMIRREVAFYLQAGSHSTANLFTHAAHRIFTSWERPGFRDRLQDDLFLQRCVHETLRLHPASPVAWRRAVADVELKSGRTFSAGELVEFDLRAANVDSTVWGANAEEFDPDRALPEGVPPWGHSFGGGMHACIGMELDGGVPPGAAPERGENHEPVLGTVTLMLRELFAHGARPDPDDPAVLDPGSERENFARYPVTFAGRAT